MALRIMLFSLCSVAFSIDGLAQNAPLIGIDSNYALDMATRNKAWKDRSEPVDPFELFAKNGCQNARIRLWVGEDGINRLTYATQTARHAKQAGLKPYLVIFLSDDWADFVKQPAPAVWKKLTPEKKLAAVAEYTESVVSHMARNGVDIDTFEIGNEIDFGICGEFEEEWPRRVSLEFMRIASLAAHGADSQGGSGWCAQGPAQSEIHLAFVAVEQRRLLHRVLEGHARGWSAARHCGAQLLSLVGEGACAASVQFSARRPARSSRHCTSR